MTGTNAHFAGSIPAHYHTHLGPTLFEPYAADLAARLSTLDETPARVLELAAGTGILTRELRRRLPPASTIVATDLNEPMLEIAKTTVGEGRIEWRQADASALPFEAGTFDAVVCQFGYMFFPDKALAAREAVRVLRPGGRFLFNVWGSLDDNAFGRIAHTTIASFFDRDPPSFYTVPFGFFDTDVIRDTLEGSGFVDVAVETLEIEGTSESAEFLARGMVCGNPTIFAIDERATAPADTIVQATAAGLANHYGDHPVRLPLKAFVITATRGVRT